MYVNHPLSRLELYISGLLFCVFYSLCAPGIEVSTARAHVRARAASTADAVHGGRKMANIAESCSPRHPDFAAGSPQTFEPLEQRPPRRRRPLGASATNSTAGVSGGVVASTYGVADAVATHPPDMTGALEGSSNFEFLPHTADVLCHGWGRDLPEALAAVVLGLNAYQIYEDDLSTVVARRTHRIQARGHDLLSLVYALLDNANFAFSQGLVSRACRVDAPIRTATAWTVSATLFGETYEPLGVHGQGTEIKAITYSAMRIEGLTESGAGANISRVSHSSEVSADVHVSVVFDI